MKHPYGNLCYRHAVRILACLVACAIVTAHGGENWYLAIQTTDTVNTPTTLAGYKAQYNTHNPNTWSDWSSALGWFGGGLYYTTTPMFVSHTGQWSMRLVRSSDLAVVGTVGPFTVTGGSPLASQAARTVTFNTPAPSTWKMTNVVHNATSYRQKYNVDLDGDGVSDYEFELNPGEDFTITGTRDTAPTKPISITAEAYMGDQQWAMDNVATVGTNAWSTSTPTVSTNSHTYTAPPDTSSKDPVKQKVSYDTPSGGSLTESTFKTGVESIRNTQSEQGKEVAEEIAKLRKQVTNQLGYDTDEPTPDSRISGAQTTTSSAKNAVTSGIGGYSTSLQGKYSVALPSSTAPPSFFAISLPGTSYKLDWNPTTHYAGWWAWGKALLQWMLWLTFAGWAIQEALTACRQAALSPQASSSSTLPGVSSGIALAAGVAILVVMATLVAGTLGYAVQLALDASTSTSWTSFSTDGVTFANIVALAETFIPLTTALSLAVTGIVFHLTANTAALTAMAAIRALGV